jgi:predicted Zn-dependent peptidase
MAKLLRRLPVLKNRLLDEEIHAAVISGMNVFVLPKRGFRRQYAEICVNYGSNDNVFIPHGAESPVCVPPGVAHFLEHKMFEKSWGDAFSAFASFGASANAYTTNNPTSYHFWSLDNYDKGLELLAEVVFVPYFTKESVEKEKNIIAQEINMYEDQPDWRIFRETLGRLYKEHPVRLDIAGNYESIQQIDENILHVCHENFYCPENTTLFMAGDFDPDQVLELAGKVIAKYVHAPRKPPVRVRPDEPSNVDCDVRISLPVPTPLLNVGWKDNHLLNGREMLKREIACTFLLDIMFGKSSDFFAEVHNRGLTDDLGFSYEAWPDYAFAIVSAETEDPDALNEMILAEAERIQEEGIDEREFERKKKAALGRFITVFRSFESVAMSQIRLSSLGEDLFSYGTVIESLNIFDINASMDCLAQGMKVSVIVANEEKNM